MADNAFTNGSSTIPTCTNGIIFNISSCDIVRTTSRNTLPVFNKLGSFPDIISCVNGISYTATKTAGLYYCVIPTEIPNNVYSDIMDDPDSNNTWIQDVSSVIINSISYPNPNPRIRITGISTSQSGTSSEISLIGADVTVASLGPIHTIKYTITPIIVPTPSVTTPPTRPTPSPALPNCIGAIVGIKDENSITQYTCYRSSSILFGGYTYIDSNNNSQPVFSLVDNTTNVYTQSITPGSLLRVVNNDPLIIKIYGKNNSSSKVPVLTPNLDKALLESIDTLIYYINTAPSGTDPDEEEEEEEEQEGNQGNQENKKNSNSSNIVFMGMGMGMLMIVGVVVLIVIGGGAVLVLSMQAKKAPKISSKKGGYFSTEKYLM
jgi:hypothetical protein